MIEVDCYSGSEKIGLGNLDKFKEISDSLRGLNCVQSIFI